MVDPLGVLGTARVTKHLRYGDYDDQHHQGHMEIMMVIMKAKGKS